MGVFQQGWIKRPFLHYHTQPKVFEKMGQRREPRKPIEVPVRIFGTDAGGKIFSENVTTLDVSQHGTKLRGVRARVKVEEIIGATYGQNKVHFRVKWAGEAGSPTDGQIGLLNLTPERPFWDFPFPSDSMDNFSFANRERRQSVRVQCSISAELHPLGQPVIWSKVSDLSLGGCFVEMPIPLPVHAKIEIALWLGETKLRLRGEVVSTSPGFGMGVRFTSLSPENHEVLRRHLQTIT
jgi:PilZ domain